jgi:peptidoglycan L-alanyl-D-glutamate endopeptidase CwlK
MSAGVSKFKPNNSLAVLAPKFRDAVEAALAECNAAPNNYDAVVYETYRSQELQAHYYARGRTVKPPYKTVTNASTNLRSWHGYGLAVDVIHRTKYWEPVEGFEWFKKVAVVFKKHNCKWGGDWKSVDPPHFQWHLCKPSPSDAARDLIATEGLIAVWEAVGAD